VGFPGLLGYKAFPAPLGYAARRRSSEK